MTKTTASLIPGVILAGLIVIPRVLRLVAPAIHVESPEYIYNAFLITKGMVPFADFEQLHPPVLEMIIAGLYYLFGISARVPEVLSAAAQAASAVILYRLVSRWRSRQAGYISAVVYSWHLLLFRYHLLARETFSVLVILAGLDLMTRKNADSWTTVTAGLLFGFGFACEQTALVFTVSIIVYILIFTGNTRHATGVFSGFLFISTMITAGYFLVFGKMYTDSVFIRFFTEGYTAPWNLKALWTFSEVRWLMPPAIAAICFVKSPGTDKNWIWVISSAAYLCFFWFVFPDYSTHNLLAVLPALSAMCGITASELYYIVKRVLSDRKKTENTPGNSRGVTYVSAGISLIIIIAGTGLYVFYFPELPAGATAQYGFSGVLRSELQEAAEAIRSNTEMNEGIIADPVVALEAQRVNVLRHRFSRHHIPLIETAFYLREIGAVQQDYFLFLRDDYLLMQDMVVVFANENYTIWVRAPGGGVTGEGEVVSQVQAM